MRNIQFGMRSYSGYDNVWSGNDIGLLEEVVMALNECVRIYLGATSNFPPQWIGDFGQTFIAFFSSGACLITPAHWSFLSCAPYFEKVFSILTADIYVLYRCLRGWSCFHFLLFNRSCSWALPSDFWIQNMFILLQLLSLNVLRWLEEVVLSL
jgi:hypothetical protein